MERVFRDVKSLLETRPVFHQNDANIAGHVFCSFLALVLRKELDQRLSAAGHRFRVVAYQAGSQGAQASQSSRRDGKRFAIRSECKGNCGKIFQAVGVALPPTIRAVE